MSTGGGGAPAAPLYPPDSFHPCCGADVGGQNVCSVSHANDSWWLGAGEPKAAFSKEIGLCCSLNRAGPTRGRAWAHPATSLSTPTCGVPPSRRRLLTATRAQMAAASCTELGCLWGISPVGGTSLGLTGGEWGGQNRLPWPPGQSLGQLGSGNWELGSAGFQPEDCCAFASQSHAHTCTQAHTWAQRCRLEAWSWSPASGQGVSLSEL